MRILLALAVLISGVLPAAVRDLTLASWNLGWHMSLAEARAWIAACSQPFVLSGATGFWEPVPDPSAPGAKRGWELKWGRDAKIAWDIGVMAPCDAYQANWKIVPVTEAAYAKRIGQVRAVIVGLEADVLAFQEVSGEQSVREVLPDNGAGYSFCAFSSHAVQRLVIAWKTTLGTGVECQVEDALSLPGNPADKRPRPGLSVVLVIDGKRLRVMTVHLKSSCVSPLEATDRNPRKGQLAGGDDNCVILQQQVGPLEAWLEKATGPTVVLGDFNRNLPHEVHAFKLTDVRTDGSDPKGPRQPGVLVKSLIGEVNDGTPEGTLLALVDMACPTNAVTADYCRRAKTEAFTIEALRPLTRWENLGCRNPIGLDHVLVSSSLSVGAAAEKVAIGKFGGTRPASDRFPDPLLAVSDHCPVKMRVSF
jgi:endonuclease/exonuclease/phosphatase family metal-dependent hydrolase